MSIHDNDDVTESMHSGTSNDADVLFTVLHAEGPVTVRQVVDHLGLPYTTAHHALLRLYRSGKLLRREQPTEFEGQNPHEYVVAPVDGHEPHIGAVACDECGRESNVLAPGVECTYRYCEGVFEPA